MNIGHHDCENLCRVWVRDPRVPAHHEEAVWLWDETKLLKSHDPMDRVGGPYRIVDFIGDQSIAGDRWFLFAVADCAFPLHDLVRADSWEEAYEIYCDWAAEHRHIKIEQPNLSDYVDEQGEYNGSYTSDGTPIDTENVCGFEVTLLSLEFNGGLKHG